MGTKFEAMAKLWAHILKADYLKPKHPGVGIGDSEEVQDAYNQRLDDKMHGSFVRAFRCFLSFIVNCLFYDIILYTLPLLLMTSETMLDFVKDAFAVVFIVTLDDVKVPKENVIVCPIHPSVQVVMIGEDEVSE